MRTATFALAALALAAAPVLAEGTVDVQTRIAARVYLNGEYVGDAPLRLSGIVPGDHSLQIESPVSGEVKTYFFHSPDGAHVQKTLQIDFDEAAPEPEPEPVVVPQPASATTVAYCPAPRGWGQRYGYRPQPVRRVRHVRRVHPATVTSTVVGTPPIVAGSPAFGRHGSQKQRAKVHTRNALLGLTAASQVFTKDRRDRKRFRNVGLGLTVLNEILR